MKPAMKTAQTRAPTRTSRDCDDDGDEDDDITNFMAHCSMLCNCIRLTGQQNTSPASFKIKILFFVIKMLLQPNVTDPYKTLYTGLCLLIMGSVLSSRGVFRCSQSAMVLNHSSVCRNAELLQ